MSLKKHLTAEQIAAIASGAVLDTSAQNANTEDAAALAAAAAAAALVKTPEQIAEDAAATAAAAQAETDRVAAEAAAVAVAAVPVESELVKFLRGEMAAANGAIVAKEVELSALRLEVQTARETQPKLLEIARSAVGRMKIALGGSDGAASALSAVEVIAAHAETSEIFSKKFVVGGAASTGAAIEPPAKKPAATVTPIFSAIAKSAK